MRESIDLEVWADETVVGRQIFNHNYRMTGSEAEGWSLVKAVTVHRDDTLSERSFIWQELAAPERLVRVDVAELPAWREAQHYLADMLDQAMRPDFEAANEAVAAVGDVLLEASSPEAEAPESLRFSRGNVTVAVSSVGAERVDVSGFARFVDRALAAEDAPEAVIGEGAAADMVTVEATPTASGVVAEISPDDEAWVQVVAPGAELRREGWRIVVQPGGAESFAPRVVTVRRSFLPR